MNINIYNPYVRRELELYHHGILGQKWGKRNGPPYPLTGSTMSYSEKKAKGISVDKKKVAKIAGAVGGAALVGAGLYAAHKTGLTSHLAEAGSKLGDKVALSASEKAYNTSKAVSDSITKYTKERHNLRHERSKETIKSLTDSELNARITRLTKENTYAELIGRTKLNGVSEGRRISKKILEDFDNKIIVPVGVGLSAYAIKTFVGEPDAKREILKNINQRDKKR